MSNVIKLPTPVECRDWLTLWIECASDETLDEFVERVEREERAPTIDPDSARYYVANLAAQQNIYPQTIQYQAVQNAYASRYGLGTPLTGLGGILGGLLGNSIAGGSYGPRRHG